MRAHSDDEHFQSMSNTRPRSQSVGGGERNRQHILNAMIPPEMAPAIEHISAPPSFLFTPNFAGLYPDPLDDVLRSLTTTYDTQSLPQHYHYTQHPTDESDLPFMSPHHQQLDSTTLAWLQLLQGQVPAQHGLGVGGSNEVQTGVQGQPERPPTQHTHLPDEPADPDEENDSETERTATAEDKRRRNTAASARFRNKKKQWLLNMERTVTSLSRQVDELEREAADLRRENGWLKEIVMLRTRKLAGGGPVINLSGSLGDKNGGGQSDAGKGKQRQR